MKTRVIKLLFDGGIEVMVPIIVGHGMLEDQQVELAMDKLESAHASDSPFTYELGPVKEIAEEASNLICPYLSEESGRKETVPSGLFDQGTDDLEDDDSEPV